MTHKEYTSAILRAYNRCADFVRASQNQKVINASYVLDINGCVARMRNIKLLVSAL